MLAAATATATAAASSWHLRTPKCSHFARARAAAGGRLAFARAKKRATKRLTNVVAANSGAQNDYVRPRDRNDARALFTRGSLRFTSVKWRDLRALRSRAQREHKSAEIKKGA